ncbi:MAG: TetR/AcrR family transcriptional regulator [Neomegalonema sp.]|nr:TetR/AcrR family transcriptional regulator [Neomegalonema sp.]
MDADAVRRAMAACEERRGKASPNAELSSKERILECAIALLGEGGYTSLTISAICKAADVSPTSIYWHFGDKAGLMSAMVKYSLKRDIDRFVDELMMRLSEDTFIDAYIRVLRDLIVNDRPSCWSVLSTLAEGRSAAPEVAAVVNEARRKQVEFAQSWGVSVLGARRPEIFADTVVAFNTFAANVYQQSRDEQEIDRILTSFRGALTILANELMVDRRLDQPGLFAALSEAGYDPTSDGGSQGDGG